MGLVGGSVLLLSLAFGGVLNKKAETQVAVAGDKLTITIYRSPTCSCCGGYISYLEDRGLSVKDVKTSDVEEIKIYLGVPTGTYSCHTGVIEGYFVEGHVPVEAIFKLLGERPELDGIALPGMPPGSPGMRGEKVEPFEILWVKDGHTGAFTSI